MSNLEDAIACAVHWNNLGRMCYDVFGSSLSLGVDRNGCYKSGWHNLSNIVYSIYGQPNWGFQCIILYIYMSADVWVRYEMYVNWCEWCTRKFGIENIQKIVCEEIFRQWLLLNVFAIVLVTWNSGSRTISWLGDLVHFNSLILYTY